MTTTKSDKAKFWRKHINNWMKSGMTQTAYCAQNELRIQQLHYWRSRLRLHDGTVPNELQDRFVPVLNDRADESTQVTCLGVQIVFPSGIMIECIPTTDVHWVGTLAGEVHRI